jgi:Acetyltransferase (GNAT) domain
VASAATGGRGYSHPGYASSLSEFGIPRQLPECGGWVLEREISGTSARDLMGPYPIFACADWSALPADLEEIDDSVVSLVLVVDPLANAGESDLKHAFPDHVVPLKQHYIRDLEARPSLPTHHRRHIRRASAALEVEICSDPAAYLDDWVRLYAGLVERFRVTGIRAFSREAFRRQLGLPGLVAARAEREGVTVGMALFFEDAPNAYYHLAAYSPEGYEVSASYALFALVLERLGESGVRWLDLGGGAGSGSDGNGLVRFKRGWATEDRMAYLCGRILNRPAYDELTERAGAFTTDWFPSYRATDSDLAGDAAVPRPRVETS